MNFHNTGLIAIVGAALTVAGCSAGSGSTAGGGDDGDGGSSSNGSNSSSGSGFTGSSNSSGPGGGCTDPSCIGGNPQGNCDMGLAIDSADAMDGARAIGICKVADSGNSWGVTTAEWVRSDGQVITQPELTRGKGILGNFGSAVMPREGSKLLAISSGSARNPTDPEYLPVSGDWKDQNVHGTPPGYPKTSASCSVQAGPGYDSAGLRVAMKVPSDAKSFSFNLNFYTYEFPNFICDIYNDFFVAMMDPKDPALPDGNISFDSQGNTISVNAGFLQVCTAQTASNGVFFPCMAGPGELSGTGFDDQPGNSAATGWLETKAPVTPGGNITLHFTVWDSGDGVLDSTTLIDNFKFDVDETSTGTIPDPE
jgi:hypothetical protein